MIEINRTLKIGGDLIILQNNNMGGGSIGDITLEVMIGYIISYFFKLGYKRTFT